LVARDSNHKIKALSHFKEAVAVWEHVQDRENLARLLPVLAALQFWLSDYAGSTASEERATQLAQELGIR
jgi:hypothetical protein